MADSNLLPPRVESTLVPLVGKYNSNGKFVLTGTDQFEVPFEYSLFLDTAEDDYKSIQATVVSAKSGASILKNNAYVGSSDGDKTTTLSSEYTTINTGDVIIKNISSAKALILPLNPKTDFEVFKPFTNYKVLIRFGKNSISSKDSIMGTSYNNAINKVVSNPKDLNGNALARTGKNITKLLYYTWLLKAGRYILDDDKPVSAASPFIAEAYKVNLKKFNTATVTTLAMAKGFTKSHYNLSLIKTYLGTKEKPYLYRQVSKNSKGKVNTGDPFDFLVYQPPNLSKQVYQGGVLTLQKVAKVKATDPDKVKYVLNNYYGSSASGNATNDSHLEALLKVLKVLQSRLSTWESKVSSLEENHGDAFLFDCVSVPFDEVHNANDSLYDKLTAFITAIENYVAKEDEVYKAKSAYVTKTVNKTKADDNKTSAETKSSNANTTLSDLKLQKVQLVNDIKECCNKLKNTIDQLSSKAKAKALALIDKAVAYVKRFLYNVVFNGGTKAISAFTLKDFSAIYGDTIETLNVFSYLKKIFDMDYSKLEPGKIERACLDAVKSFFKDFNISIDVKSMTSKAFNLFLTGLAALYSVGSDKHNNLKSLMTAAESAHKKAIEAYKKIKDEITKLTSDKTELFNRLKKLKGGIVNVKDLSKLSVTDWINGKSTKVDSLDKKISNAEKTKSNAKTNVETKTKELSTAETDVADAEKDYKSLLNELEGTANKVISAQKAFFNALVDYDADESVNNANYADNVSKYLTNAKTKFDSKVKPYLNSDVKKSITTNFTTAIKEINTNSKFVKCPALSRKSAVKLYDSLLAIRYCKIGSNTYYFDGYFALSKSSLSKNKELNTFYKNLTAVIEYVLDYLSYISHYQKQALKTIEYFNFFNVKRVDKGSEKKYYNSWLYYWNYKKQSIAVANCTTLTTNFFAESGGIRNSAKKFLLSELTDKEIVRVYSDLMEYTNNSDNKKGIHNTNCKNLYYNRYIQRWSINLEDEVSDWSSPCVIRAINKPEINLGDCFCKMGEIFPKTNTSTVSGSINYDATNLDIEATFSCVDDLKKNRENLDNYSIYLYRYNGTKTELIESVVGVEPTKKNKISYEFQTELKNKKSYCIKISYETENGYKNSIVSKKFTCKLSGYLNNIEVGTYDYPGIANLSLSLYEDNEEGRVTLKLWDAMDKEKKYLTNFCIRRADSNDDYKIWRDIKILPCNNDLVRGLHEVYDYTILSGRKYIYGVQLIRINGKRGPTVYNSEKKVQRDFYFSYLLGEGGKQLKLKFNQTIDNYRYVKGENKIETLGGKYPIIIKNGQMNYRSFPINGLISYMMDDDNTFNTDEVYKNYDLIEGSNFSKTEYPTIEVEYDYLKEYNFRKKVISFLLDGKPKLFKSATEGNILVALINVSFLPKNELSRMIYDFTSEAYEIGAANMSNYQKYNFYDVGDYIKHFNVRKYITRVGQYRTTDFNADVNLIQRIYSKYELTITQGNFTLQKVKPIRIYNLSLEFQDAPKVYGDKLGDIEIDGKESTTNDGFIGHCISIALHYYASNGTTIKTASGKRYVSHNTQGIYNFGEEIEFRYRWDSNGKYLGAGKWEDSIKFIAGKNHGSKDKSIADSTTIIANFLYDVLEEEYDEPQIKSQIDENRLGQYRVNTSSGTNIFGKIYAKYYHKLSDGGDDSLFGDKITKLTGLSYSSIEAAPGAVFKIDTTENLDLKNYFVMNETGTLTFDDLGDITSLTYLGMQNESYRNKSYEDSTTTVPYEKKKCDICVNYVATVSTIKYFTREEQFG